MVPYAISCYHAELSTAPLPCVAFSNYLPSSPHFISYLFSTIMPQRPILVPFRQKSFFIIYYLNVFQVCWMLCYSICVYCVCMWSYVKLLLKVPIMLRLNAIFYKLTLYSKYYLHACFSYMYTYNLIHLQGISLYRSFCKILIPNCKKYCKRSRNREHKTLLNYKVVLRMKYEK